MLCQEAFELMNAQLDGELGSAGSPGGDRTAALREHLGHCPSCRERQLALAGLTGKMRSLRTTAPVTPAALRSRIQAECARHCAAARLAEPLPELRSNLRPPVRSGVRSSVRRSVRPALVAAAAKHSRSRSRWSVVMTAAVAAVFALFLLGMDGTRLLPSSGSSPSVAVLPSSSSPARVLQGSQEACRVATSGESPVALACATDGRAGAIRVMEQLTELARSRGIDLQCATCHLDDRGFGLTAGAREKFASLLAASRT